MLSNTDAAPVTIGLAVLKKRKRIAPQSTNGTNEDPNSHTKTS
jgi:hypothetical protein